MKLSEAIKEGAKLTKPQIGRFAYLGHDGLRCCALGAAAYYLEGEVMPVDESRVVCNIIKSHQIDIEQWIAHPVRPGVFSLPVKMVVQELNDCYDWTREQIADWLEGLGL